MSKPTDRDQDTPKGRWEARQKERWMTWMSLNSDEYRRLFGRIASEACVSMIILGRAARKLRHMAKRHNCPRKGKEDDRCSHCYKSDVPDCPICEVIDLLDDASVDDVGPGLVETAGKIGFVGQHIEWNYEIVRYIQREIRYQVTPEKPKAPKPNAVVDPEEKGGRP